MLEPHAQLPLETAVLTLSRLTIFLACRKYLLRHLYHDLQDLSTTEGVDTTLATEDAGFELTSLPTPSSSAKPAKPRRPFHSMLSRALFSLCFSESCMLFLLLMCQAAELLHPRTRLLNWTASLSILLAAILVVIPLSYSLVLGGPLHFRVRLLLNTLPAIIFLLLLSSVPLPTATPSSGFVEAAVSRLTVLGTPILGALSGFGAINTAWTFFPAFHGNRKANPTGEDIRAAEDGLKRVQDELARRQTEVRTLEAAQPDHSPSWFSRMTPSFRSETPLSSAQTELGALSALASNMSQNLAALNRRQSEARFAQTYAGKAFRWAGRAFAVYCVLRIVSSIANLIFPRAVQHPSEAAQPSHAGGSADMISTGLAYLFSLLPMAGLAPDGSDNEAQELRIALISRQISLALVGVIILSSIRMVLRGVARALRLTSRNPNVGASLMLLILAQLMGIYLLSTLVQLRTSFPPPPSAHPDPEPDSDAAITTPNLFSTLPEYQLFGSLFDGAFLLAAGASAVVRWFGDRIRTAGEAEMETD